MDAILQALVGILIKAVPTFILVILLNLYAKYTFFRPMEKVLRERYDVTEGARKAAEESMQRASARTAEYEAAMRSARAEVYQAQEKIHKELQERYAADLASARERAEAVVQQARDQLAADVEAAKASLARDAEALSTEIANVLLKRSAA